MRQSVSLIIHAAWPVNFNLPFFNYERHVRSLYNLIEFSLSVARPSPALVMYRSSISTVLGSSSSEIAESPVKELTSALQLGYSHSKFIGEPIVINARKSGARAYSLRIGQVSGRSEKKVSGLTQSCSTYDSVVSGSQGFA